VILDSYLLPALNYTCSLSRGLCKVASLLSERSQHHTSPLLASILIPKALFAALVHGLSLLITAFFLNEEAAGLFPFSFLKIFSQVCFFCHPSARTNPRDSFFSKAQGRLDASSLPADLQAISVVLESNIPAPQYCFSISRFPSSFSLQLLCAAFSYSHLPQGRPLCSHAIFVLSLLPFTALLRDPSLNFSPFLLLSVLSVDFHPGC